MHAFLWKLIIKDEQWYTQSKHHYFLFYNFSSQADEFQQTNVSLYSKANFWKGNAWV